jgi:hypothetical protein
VLLALIVGTTPIASRAVTGPIGQISRDLEEAARTAGASGFRATTGILLRLILPSFVVSWFITGIVSSGNLDIPILLASANNQPVPLLAYNQFNGGSLSQAAATFCLLIGIVAAVLDGFSLRANQGELVTLLGPGGCGKTTTLRCIAGLERAEQGEIRIGERLVACAERRCSCRRTAATSGWSSRATPCGRT